MRVGDGERERTEALVARLQAADAAAAADETGSSSGGDDGEEEERDGAGRSACRALSDATLARLASSAAPSLSDLSEDEARVFAEAVGRGELSHLVEPWTPWWTLPTAGVRLRADGTALLQDAAGGGGAGDNGEEPGGVPPPPSTPLPLLKSLFPGAPSPLLACHVADALAAYCVACRTYNGEWHDDAAGFASFLLDLSATLAPLPGAAAAAGPATVASALRGVALRSGSGVASPVVVPPTTPPSQRAPHPPGAAAAAVAAAAAATAAHGDWACHDASSVLSLGRGAVLCALADARRAVAAAALSLSQPAPLKGGGGGGGGARSRADGTLRSALLRADRKLLFLSAWAAEAAPLQWGDAAAAAGREAARVGRSARAVALEGPEGRRKRREAAMPRKPLVTELGAPAAA